MRNILNIITHDARKLTSSVVAIITIMGLCIVPCLYAWFNIFSNWAPYEAEATGRILVAVANEDRGAVLLGLDVNVGDRIVDALKANDSIGWRFVESSDEAVEGVRAGDYYAALIVPEDFSMDAMSFATGELKNPKLVYYENEKKNAVAPKITGKAKTALQEQVNAAFVETLAKYVSDAATVMEASGYDPQRIFSDLGDKMDELSTSLESCEAMLSSAEGLAESASSLLEVSDTLLGSAELTVEGSEDLIDSATVDMPDNSKVKKSASDAIFKEKNNIDEDLSGMSDELTEAMQELAAYNKYVDTKLLKRQEQIEKMRLAAEKTESYLRDLGYNSLADRFGKIKDRLAEIGNAMAAMEKADEQTWEKKKAEMLKLQDKIADTREELSLIDPEKVEALDADLQKAISDTRKAAANVRRALSGMEGDLSGLGDVLAGYSNALARLEGSLGSTDVSLGYMSNGISAMAEIFDRIASNKTMDDVGDVLANKEASVAEYLASPVKMKTEVIYPIETYGSAMSPFYTVLAQWVGSLLTAVLIKTGIRKRKDLPDNIRLTERFFGRYGLYLFIGLAQALIVSLGNLLYVGIQCLHPVLYVLQACMNGIVFMMINYALVFSLDNIGLGAGVIILLMQVAGSGGTYPVEVLPRIFRVLCPVMPFRYSMNAMRECIAGTYGHTYAKCMCTLALFFVGAVVFGLVMYKPAQWLNRLIAESKEKSEIML